jgi:hypothetical protein
MSALILELPESLRAAIAGDAARRSVSESAWLEEAAREKLAAEAELAYLRERAARANRAAYENVLNRVPAAPPEPGDERKPADGTAAPDTGGM